MDARASIITSENCAAATFPIIFFFLRGCFYRVMVIQSMHHAYLPVGFTCCPLVVAPAASHLTPDAVTLLCFFWLTRVSLCFAAKKKNCQSTKPLRLPCFCCISNFSLLPDSSRLQYTNNPVLTCVYYHSHVHS